MVTIIFPDRFLGILPKGRRIFRADLPKRQFQPQMRKRDTRREVGKLRPSW